MSPALLCNFQNVGLSYRRRFGRTSTLKERALLWLRGARRSEIFWALQDVSFEIRSGETIGLIGANGSGKSSLLKLIAGIYPPDRGTVRVAGRVAALLELGAGFQPDLTGRENVHLYGAILGLGAKEIEGRFEEIREFSGLGELIDTPVRHFSSGMVTRLGFSVVAHLNPDLLLVDEILAVGDFNFQQKCIDHMVGYLNSGRSLLFVSHDLDALAKLCHRAIWLDQGRLVLSGPTQTVLEAYRTEMEHRRGTELPAPRDRFQRWGTGEVEIRSVRLLDPAGHEIERAVPGSPLHLEVGYIAHQAVEDPVMGLGIHHQNGTVLSGPNTRLLGCQLRRVEGQGAVRFYLDSCPFLPGEYGITASVYDASLTHAYDHRERAWTLQVAWKTALDAYGSVVIPWKVDPGA